MNTGRVLKPHRVGNVIIQVERLLEAPRRRKHLQFRSTRHRCDSIRVLSFLIVSKTIMIPTHLLVSEWMNETKCWSPSQSLKFLFACLIWRRVSFRFPVNARRCSRKQVYQILSVSVPEEPIGVFSRLWSCSSNICSERSRAVRSSL